jgi:hypothetical protein
MSMEAIGKYLETRRIGRLGVDIFVNEMPESCTQGVLLRDRYSGTPIDPYLPKYRQTGYRMAVRSPDYAAGKELAWKASEALTIHGETPMGEVLVKLLRPMNEPRSYRRSIGGLWEFEVDLEAVLISAR